MKNEIKVGNTILYNDKQIFFRLDTNSSNKFQFHLFDNEFVSRGSLPISWVEVLIILMAKRFWKHLESFVFFEVNKWMMPWNTSDKWKK